MPTGAVVKFHGEAVAKDGELFGVGLNFLVLAADGRIERGYTFVVAWSGWTPPYSESRKLQHERATTDEIGAARSDRTTIKPI